MLSESRGHSHENWFLAHCAALIRAACLTGLATGTGTFSDSGSEDSVRSETCCTSACGAGGGSTEQGTAKLGGKVPMRLDNFLSDTPLCFKGQWASRTAIIKYVALIGHGRADSKHEVFDLD